MRRVLSWFESRFEPKPDPELERWVWACGQEVARRILEEREGFQFDSSLSELGAVEYRPLVADRAYRTCLKKAWADLKLCESERAHLTEIAATLGIQAGDQFEIDAYTEKEVFNRLLEKSLEDGVIDSNELKRLESVAASSQRTLASMVTHYLASSGRAFLDNIAACAQSDGAISDADWKRAISVLSTLGLSEAEFLKVVRPQAEKLLDHVIERIMADGTIREEEIACVASLIERLHLGSEATDKLEGATHAHSQVVELVDPDIDEVAKAFNSRAEDADLLMKYSGATADFETRLDDLRNAKWWQASSGKNGASAAARALVDIRPVWTSRTPPRGIRDTVPCCNLSLNSGAICLIPGGALVLAGGQAVGIPCQKLAVTTSKFATSENLGPGAQAIGKTWRHVDSSGKADPRFKDNPEMPVYSVANVEFPGTGVRLRTANVGALERFIERTI